jgi:hypothetical protein
LDDEELTMLGLKPQLGVQCVSKPRGSNNQAAELGVNSFVDQAPRDDVAALEQVSSDVHAAGDDVTSPGALFDWQSARINVAAQASCSGMNARPATLSASPAHHGIGDIDSPRPTVFQKEEEKGKEEEEAENVHLPEVEEEVRSMSKKRKKVSSSMIPPQTDSVLMGSASVGEVVQFCLGCNIKRPSRNAERWDGHATCKCCYPLIRYKTLACGDDELRILSLERRACELVVEACDLLDKPRMLQLHGKWRQTLRDNRSCGIAEAMATGVALVRLLDAILVASNDRLASTKRTV